MWSKFIFQHRFILPSVCSACSLLVNKSIFSSVLYIYIYIYIYREREREREREKEREREIDREREK